MRPNRTLEIGTGLFVLLGFAALGFLTTQLPSSGLKFGGKKAGYHVVAKFDNIGDLKSGSPVSMAGVRVGDVESIRYDPKEFKAAVTLRIDPSFNQIPDDSDASIQTQGLLGGKYIGIGPGGSDILLKDGSQFAFNQWAIVLESLVNKFFANFASKGDNSSGGDSSGSKDSSSDSGGDAGKEKQK
jgi:phospholipid/cholesterol/gamma-HCH transport system substrate-binding protein